MLLPQKHWISHISPQTDHFQLSVGISGAKLKFWYKLQEVARFAGFISQYALNVSEVQIGHNCLPLFPFHLMLSQPISVWQIGAGAAGWWTTLDRPTLKCYYRENSRRENTQLFRLFKRRSLQYFTVYRYALFSTYPLLRLSESV